MRSGSSELLLDQQQELRKRKLLELAQPRRGPAAQKTRKTCRQRLWLYATWLLAAAVTGGGAALLFLVPLYVDPAISTLAADFSPEPVTCLTTRREDLSGLFNCTWSSCREGCTSDMYSCVHIFVNYELPGKDPNTTVVREAVLLANIKGCGYPPDVECSNFTASYGQLGTTFPCHYSRQNSSLVLSKYSRDVHVAVITHFFAVPLVVTLVASLLLCAMHCDCSGDGGRRRGAVEDFSDSDNLDDEVGARGKRNRRKERGFLGAMHPVVEWICCRGRSDKGKRSSSSS